MVNWLHSPSIVPLLLVTCAAAALVTGDLRGRDPPTALVFGLLIGFLAAGVWSNSWNAQQAVDSEASALRWVDLLDRDFPAADQRRMDLLIRSYIEQAVTHEWPAMAHQNATLVAAPPQMALALQVALGLSADDPGRVVRRGRARPPHADRHRLRPQRQSAHGGNRDDGVGVRGRRVAVDDRRSGPAIRRSLPGATTLLVQVESQLPTLAKFQKALKIAMRYSVVAITMGSRALPNE